MHASMAGPRDKLRESYVDTARVSDPQPHVLGRPFLDVFESAPPAPAAVTNTTSPTLMQPKPPIVTFSGASDTSMLVRMVAPAQPPLLPAPLYFYNMGARRTNQQQISPGHRWAIQRCTQPAVVQRIPLPIFNAYRVKRIRRRTYHRQKTVTVGFLNLQEARRNRKWQELLQEMEAADMSLFGVAETHLRDFAEPPVHSNGCWLGCKRVEEERRGS